MTLFSDRPKYSKYHLEYPRTFWMFLTTIQICAIVMQC